MKPAPAKEAPGAKTPPKPTTAYPPLDDSKFHEDKISPG